MKLFILLLTILATQTALGQVKKAIPKNNKIKQIVKPIAQKKITNSKTKKSSAPPSPYKNSAASAKVAAAKDITDAQLLNKIKTTVPEKDAEFAGGNAGYRQFLQQHLIYPYEAREKYRQGSVYVNFVVCTDGSICNIEVDNERSVKDASLRNEALRVVKLSPNWQPAELNKQKVQSFYRLPITFAMDEEE